MPFGDVEESTMGDGMEICELVEALLFCFGWGLLSLPLVSWISRCAKKAGAAHAELDVLAGLGSNGLHPGNMRRDCLRHFVKGSTVPRPILYPVPVLGKMNNVTVADHCDIHIVCP